MVLDTQVTLGEKDLEFLRKAVQDVSLDGQDSIFWDEYTRARDALDFLIARATANGMNGETYRALFSGEKPFYVTEPDIALGGQRFIFSKEFYLNIKGLEKGNKAYKKKSVILRKARSAAVYSQFAA